MIDKKTYAEKFDEWWDDKKPFGFDHPDTHDPIFDLFVEADGEICFLKLERSKIKRENYKLQEIAEQWMNDYQKLKDKYEPTEVHFDD